MHGVLGSAHFVMKNSKTYNQKISAMLYDGKMYYGSVSVMGIVDKLYLASLAAAFVVFCLNILQIRDIMYK